MTTLDPQLVDAAAFRGQSQSTNGFAPAWREPVRGRRWDCHFRELVDQGLDLVLRVAGRLINEPDPRGRDYREHHNGHERHCLDNLLWGKIANPVEVERISGCHKTSMERAADSFAATRRPLNRAKPSRIGSAER
ncbi:MAG: hypothetical protein ACTHOK_19745 [Nocardioidaceae bacterium]